MAKSSNKRKRILLVEDEEDAWEIVAFALEGYTLFYARDFNEGLRQARRGYFDLYILTTICLAGMGSSCAASFASSTRTRRYCSTQRRLPCLTCMRLLAQARTHASSSRPASMNLRGRLRD